MGSAAVCELSRRGKRVLGLEQFTPAHDRGSSHGGTRVIRQSYYENPAYVPLLLRAYELWRQLEKESQRSLLVQTGGLMIGTERSEVVTGSFRSATEHGLRHEMLDATELQRRFPPFDPTPDTIALWEETAGFLWTEDAVQAHLDVGAVNGADLHFEETVEGWEASEGSVQVKTSKGRYQAESLIVTPGPWAPQLLSELGMPLTVERQVLYWFDAAGGLEPFSPDRFPIFVWDGDGGNILYGFPAVDGPSGGMKTAFYRAPEVEACSPDSIDRVVRDREMMRMRDAASRRIPSLCGRLVKAVTCMYTNTPDQNFVMTQLPGAPQVTVACGFSGHGFKFCSVVGEILADLATRGESRHDLQLFRLGRF